MEDIGSSFTKKYRRNKRITVVAAFLFAVVFGPLNMAVKDGSLGAGIADLASLLGTGLLTFSWCYFDCLEHNRPITRGLRLLIVFLGPIGLCIYLLESRGVKRGLVSSAKACGMFAALFLAMILSAALIAALFIPVP